MPRAKSKLLPLSTKEYNYRILTGQISLNLTKFVVNILMFMSPNKFIMKIYYITNLMILILYYEPYYFYITLVKI
jgi:hypothetical protein